MIKKDRFFQTSLYTLVDDDLRVNTRTHAVHLCVSHVIASINTNVISVSYGLNAGIAIVLNG